MSFIFSQYRREANVHGMIIVRVYIVVYRHTGISLQPYSLIKAGISVRLSVCLHFYYVENRSSNDFMRGGCVAADPRKCSVAFWCNMDTRHVQN